MKLRLMYLAAGMAAFVMLMILWSMFRTPAKAQNIGGASVATAFSCYPTGPLACTVLNDSAANKAWSCFSPSGIGAAGSLRARTVVSVSSITQANPAVLTSTGHGFTLNTRPVVTISGVTGAGWSAINNTWVATIVDANTFSVPFNSGALGAPTTTGSFTTTAPRTTVAEWAVQKFFYSGVPSVITTVWLGNIIAGTNLPAGPAASFSFKCSDAPSGTTMPLQ